MDLAQASVPEQLAAFERMILSNPTLETVLGGARDLDLPGWYLAAGALFETVWNCLSGRDPEQGIRDYDLIYFDDRDLSWEAEDATIRRAAAQFGALGDRVEVRNQARVHLWYERKFGTPCPPHRSCESAIDAYAATTCCLGVRLQPDGRMRVYAPHGFADVFGFVLRPNPVLAPPAVYAAKAARWRGEWPRLRILPWTADADVTG